jgi:hypothetical protein
MVNCKRNSQVNSSKVYPILVLLIYLVAGLLLLKYYRYQINPDGISYISIAQKYLAGDFHDAINGFWGPMLSWLLAPLLAVGTEPLLAAKILNLLIGAAAIIALWALSYRFEMRESIRTVILFCAVPVVLSFAFSDITPDLLVMCLLLFYLGIIFKRDYAASTKYGAVCGLWGGLSYLAKSYGFPFFISHFFIMNVLHYLRSETKEVKKKVVRNFLAGAAVFALISGVWIGLISNKYKEFTFGTSGKIAYGSVVSAGFQGLGVYWQGFLEPPNETAISVWEDPSYLLKPLPREKAGRWDFVKEQAKITTGLIGEIGKVFVGFSVLSIAIGIAYVLFWLRRFNKAIIRGTPPEVLYPTIMIAIYAGGYSLVVVRARYLWVLCMVLMLMGGYVLNKLFENKFFTKTKRAVLLVIFFLSFAAPAFKELDAYANRGKGIYSLSEVLKSRIGQGQKIASNTNWPGTLYLSYYLGGKYYGVPKGNISGAELNSELEKYSIEYFFVWGGAGGDFGFLSNYEEISGGRIPGLQIYGLKKQR